MYIVFSDEIIISNEITSKFSFEIKYSYEIFFWYIFQPSSATEKYLFKVTRFCAGVSFLFWSCRLIQNQEQKPEKYLEPSATSMMECFCENN